MSGNLDRNCSTMTSTSDRQSRTNTAIKSACIDLIGSVADNTDVARICDREGPGVSTVNANAAYVSTICGFVVLFSYFQACLKFVNFQVGVPVPQDPLCSVYAHGCRMNIAAYRQREKVSDAAALTVK